MSLAVETEEQGTTGPEGANSSSGGSSLLPKQVVASSSLVSRSTPSKSLSRDLGCAPGGRRLDAENACATRSSSRAHRRRVDPPTCIRCSARAHAVQGRVLCPGRSLTIHRPTRGRCCVSARSREIAVGDQPEHVCRGRIAGQQVGDDLILHAVPRLSEGGGDRSGFDGEGLENPVRVVIAGEGLVGRVEALRGD